MMSRPWVSLEMQAAAPNDSIWLHSAAVGRLASTTMRVPGWRSGSWGAAAGVGAVWLGAGRRRGQGAEVEQSLGRLVLIDRLGHLGERNVGGHEPEVLVL